MKIKKKKNRVLRKLKRKEQRAVVNIGLNQIWTISFRDDAWLLRYRFIARCVGNRYYRDIFCIPKWSDIACGLSIRASRQVERDKVNLTLEEISFSSVVSEGNSFLPPNRANECLTIKR